MTTFIDLAYDGGPAAPVAPDAELAGIRDLLLEQGRTLRAQARMLEELDARRMEVEELIEVALPIVNAGMLMATRQLDAVERSSLRTRLASVRQDLDAARRQRPPGLFALVRRLRHPDVRRGLSLSIGALAALGRLSLPDEN